MLLPGQILDARYRVEGKLGEGGLASVYRVRHERLGVDYALKMLKRDDPSIRRRLLLEGSLQAALRHPNVASVVDVIDIEGAPALIIELVTGATLDHLLHYERLTIDQIDALAQGILRGVAAAHAVGTIHRDLKPANILLATHDGVLTPKITDFGLAKAFDGYSETATGALLGTPQYMAPEQIEDASSVDHRADIWSLGVILYEMISGKRPFEGTTIPGVLQLVLDGKFTPIDTVAPHAPARMRAAVTRALLVDRAQRTPTAQDLLRDWIGQEQAPSHFSTSLLERNNLRSNPDPPQPTIANTPHETFPLEVAALRAAQEVPQPASRWMWRWLAPGLVAIFAAILGLVLIISASFAVLAWRSQHAVPELVEVREPLPPSPPPLPTVTPAVPAAAPTVTPIRSPPPTPAPTNPVPAPAPTPPPTAPEPPTQPVQAPAEPQPAASPSTILVRGDFREAVIRAGNGDTVDSGTVRPGRYEIWASFNDLALTKQASVEVGPGESVVVTCSSMTLTCRRGR